MRIPFDSLTLSAVVAEVRQFEGGHVQKIVQPDEHTAVICIYRGTEGCLLLSCDPVFFRAHLTSRRPPGISPPPAFCMALRARIGNATMTNVEQVDFDRVLKLVFEGAGGVHTLMCELMGKHSNLILVDSDGKIVAAAKHVPPSKSKRPVTPGRPYERPPFEAKPPIWRAKPGDDFKAFAGASPFLVNLISAGGLDIPDIGKAFRPVLVPGSGAYPVSVASLGLAEHPRDSISIALEQHYALEIPRHEAQQLRSSLRSQLERVLLAREVALGGLEQARDAAAKAGLLQLQGELILAHAHEISEGQAILNAQDYEGQPIEIKLDPELSPVENANRFFKKAKKAKSGASMVGDQIERLSKDRSEVRAAIDRLAVAEHLDEIQGIQEEARSNRWLHTQRKETGKAEDRPFEGHRIKELLGPQGLRILYGESATANDYLTMRVAKPNDYWLHVRAGTSAHVVIATNNHPEKVGMEALMFAAQVAVRNSASKHSGYVPVDYTLKKYVRKPRGAQPGTALYTHEKTLHVEG